MQILVINPGSTSTKIAVYEDEAPLFTENVVHHPEDLARHEQLFGQLELRRRVLLETLSNNAVDMKRLSAVVGRGGMLSPLKGGGYAVNEAMIRDLRAIPHPQHASNLGAPLAFAVAEELRIPSFIYDAVGTDELADVARLTGLPEVNRESFCHVLNAKAMARKAAAALGGTYEAMRFIVAHLGGGISVSAHENGRIIDVITDDAGPFSPERSGGIPLSYIIDICYNSGRTEKELLLKIRRNSGIKGHLGTNDCREVERRIAAGDETARRVYEAQAYQIAKGIGEMAPVLCGRVDAVILTGGMAYSGYITAEVSKRVGYLGNIAVMPGENEMEALAFGALRILRGEEGFHAYR